MYKNEVLEVISGSRARITGLIRSSLDLTNTILDVPCLGRDIIPQIREDLYKKTESISSDEFSILERRGYRII
jgi:hypothetical protein